MLELAYKCSVDGHKGKTFLLAGGNETDTFLRTITNDLGRADWLVYGEVARFWHNKVPAKVQQDGLKQNSTKSSDRFKDLFLFNAASEAGVI